MWNGKQVVPKEWVAESTKPRLNTDGSLLYFGYHWWLGRSLLRGREVTWTAGIGNGGQRLYVLPELELVSLRRVPRPEFASKHDAVSRIEEHLGRATSR